MMYLVESLMEQCKNYILMNLEEFPVGHLKLLPLSTRKDLLYRLPVADICLRLENTDFTVGLDMATFWSSTWEDESVGVAGSSDDSDINSYFQKWESTEYAREVLYGLLATCAFGHLRSGEFWFHSPLYRRQDSDGEPESGMQAISLLYAVRKPCVDGDRALELKFPLRYSNKSEKRDKDLTVYEVVHCFSQDSGEFPREIEILNGIDLDNVYFLRNAVYLGIKAFPFEEQGFDFLKAALKEATNLEVLVLDHWGEDDEWEVKFFDEFCTYLSSCQTFLSNLQLFKLLSSMCQLGFVVSRKNFNQLITAYFAAPTDHEQKLEFTYTKIKCCDISYESIPNIEQRYLPFKTIKFDSTCQFVSKYKPTPQTVSHWLGQNISEVDSDSVKQVDSCYFKVKDKGVYLSRKRKHSELDAEDNDGHK